MATLPAHPFCVDVRQCAATRERFIWRIRSRQGHDRRSVATYPSFEEARVAMKVVLDQMIAEWRPCES